MLSKKLAAKSVVLYFHFIVPVYSFSLLFPVVGIFFFLFAPLTSLSPSILFRHFSLIQNIFGKRFWLSYSLSLNKFKTNTYILKNICITNASGAELRIKGEETISYKN